MIGWRRSVGAVVLGFVLASTVLVTAQSQGWRVRVGSQDIYGGTAIRPQGSKSADIGTSAFPWGTLYAANTYTSGLANIDYTVSAGVAIKLKDNSITTLTSAANVTEYVPFFTDMILNIASGTITGSQLHGVDSLVTVVPTDGATYGATTTFRGNIGHVWYEGHGAVSGKFIGMIGYSDRGLVNNATQLTGNVAAQIGAAGQTRSWEGGGTTPLGAALYAFSPTNLSGHQFTQTAGVYIEDQAPTSTTGNTPYSVYAAGATNILYNAGTERIGADTGSYTLATTAFTPNLNINSTVAGVANVYQAALSVQNSTGAFGPSLLFARSRAALTANASGDVGMVIASYAHDGTDYNTIGNMQFQVDGAVASNDTPGRFIVQTTGAATTTATTRMTIDSAGAVTLAGLATTGSATGKTVVCADTAGKLYRSSTGTDCSN